jgi:hypothetical protein
MSDEDVVGYRLSNMEFDEVSLCATGVNQESLIVLSKALPKKNKSPENCKIDHKKLKGKLPCPECGMAKGEMSKAVAGSYEDRIQRVSEALREKFGSRDNYVWARATTGTAVVYQMSVGGNEVNYMCDYTIGEDGIVFGDPVRVRFTESVVPVSKAINDNAMARSRALLSAIGVK